MAESEAERTAVGTAPKPGSFEHAQYLAFRAGYEGDLRLPDFEVLAAFRRWRERQVPDFSIESEAQGPER